MRQRLVIILTIMVVIALLVAINAASYVQVDTAPDSEAAPDRSTLNFGPTGARALFEFLIESGYQVEPWRESPSMLKVEKGFRPATIVVIGPTIVPFSKSEKSDLLDWVANGGRLILIDRHPDSGLLPASAGWKVSTYTYDFPAEDLDPNNLEQMTSGVKPVAPSQPTQFVRGVETILPSRFAARINIFSDEGKKVAEKSSKPISDKTGEDDSAQDSSNEEASSSASVSKSPPSPAPVVNFAEPGGALLVDYPHGAGHIVLLADPFIVANNGISRADNLQLAINLMGAEAGRIAFDEFHQGRGASRNTLIHYFEGTPVMALFGQGMLIIAAIVWSRGRRFARPLPLPQIDRRSSLEFVASMAELQQRAKAHDLALENIYGRVRRALVRHAGLNNNSPRAEIAGRVAARSSLDRDELESLMRKCETTINGAPTTAKETLRMVKRLRQIEAQLGLGTRDRDVKQAADRAGL